ncbi:MAG: aminoacyl-tRNA hydrolase [Firmicutes bacterium]|nr:aminoacyl-tRNA hydrolase [Bacillota bacterium]
MFVIAGLGNPGKKYEKTRHNMGFRVIDAIAEKNDIKVNKIKHKALVGDGRIAGQRVLLVKPQTFMNLSGDSLRQVMDYYDVPEEKLIVIYDDFDTDLGAIRIRKKGSAGSHNGMKSVIERLGTQDFPRIRIGIGGTGDRDWVGFVIGGMSKEEEKLVSEAVEKAAQAVEVMISDGTDMAMNRFNAKKEKKKKQKEQPLDGEEKESEGGEADREIDDEKRND